MEKDLEIWVEYKLNMTQECVLADKRAYIVLEHVKRRITSLLREAIAPSTLHWCSPASSTVCNFGFLNTRSTSD